MLVLLEKASEKGDTCLRSKRVSKKPGSFEFELEVSVWINDLFYIFNEICIF